MASLRGIFAEKPIKKAVRVDPVYIQADIDDRTEGEKRVARASEISIVAAQVHAGVNQFLPTLTGGLPIANVPNYTTVYQRLLEAAGIKSDPAKLRIDAIQPWQLLIRSQDSVVKSLRFLADEIESVKMEVKK